MGVELCPVQVLHYESKCQQLDLDEEKMLGEPHMRGVKRKFDLESEMFPQRQTIFNITMCKLTRFREKQEQSLLRSVLMFNTLRNMERDMNRDTQRLNGNSVQSAQNDYHNYNHQNVPSVSQSHETNINYHYEATFSSSSEMMTSDDNFYSNCISNPSDEPQKCRTLLELDTLSSGRITPFTRSVYDRVDAGALWNDDTDSLTSLNWSSVLNFNNSSNSQIPNNVDANKNNVPESSETCLHTLMPPTQGSLSLTTLSNSTNPLLNNGNVIGSIASYNSSGTEEIFGDIDLSLYDFDVLSPLSPPNVKLAPVTAEELMKSLAGSSEGNPAIKSNSTIEDKHFDKEHPIVKT